MAGKTALAPFGRVNVYDDPQVLGQQLEFMDWDYTNPEAPVLKGQARVQAVYVKNDSGGTLAPGAGVKFKATGIGTLIGGVSGANEICDGIVDPWLTSSVANGDFFYIIVEGPIPVLTGVGGLTAGAVLQTAVNGTFIAGTAGTNPIGHCGKAADAAAAGAKCRAYVRLPFAAVGGC